MQPFVSVIIPIYKTEHYLPRCLESLRRQSLSNIEILLINDGSPDQCGKTCDAYATKDERFKVFHQPHAGTSVARNRGIHMATSDYLMFVDSDDWVHEDYCKNAYECAVQHQADIVTFGLQRVIPHKLFGLQYRTINVLPEGILTREELINDLVQRGSSSCNKLFRKKLFNAVKYPVGYTYEDTILYKVVYQAKHIYSHNRVLYYYCFRPGSTNTIRSDKTSRDFFEMYFQRLQDLSKWNLYSLEKINLEMEKLAFTYCMIKKKDLSDSYYLLSAQTLRNAKSIPKEFTWRRKVLFFLFKHCPPLFDFICTIYGKRSS